MTQVVHKLNLITAASLLAMVHYLVKLIGSSKTGNNHTEFIQIFYLSYLILYLILAGVQTGARKVTS